MSTPDVLSEVIQYQAEKRRAVSARTFRTTINSSNSTSFKPGQTMEFDLPGNRSRQFYDMGRTYLSFKLTNAGGACNLDSAGAMSFIKQFVIETPSATLYNCNQWNVLASALLDQDASPEWLGSQGNVMLGTYGDAQRGETIAAAGVRSFVVPLALNSLAMSTPKRLVPAFSLAPISIKLGLDSQVNMVRHHDDAALADFTLSEVHLVTYVTELSGGAMAHLEKATGGIYNMLCSTYSHTSATLGSGYTSISPTLGMSSSALERLICIHRSQASNNVAEAYSIGSRATAGLTEYGYVINGEQVPQKFIKVDGRGGVAMAELMIANHSLMDYSRGCGLQNGFAALTNTSFGGQSMLSGVDPDADKPDPWAYANPAGTTAGSIADTGLLATATPSNCGKFIASVELESSLSDGRSSHIYSGISTLGGIVQFSGTYSGIAQVYDLDFYGQSTVVIGLDMSPRGTGTFTIST